MSMAGQTINDRLLAARHSLAGQGLAKSVCKATTEEMIGPKKKHLDYLVHCTNEPNVSVPQLANLLIERSQNTNWTVVFKALITVHHMMCYGNERFTQYLASSNCSFQLSNFLDKSGVQGVGVAGARVGYDMSPFIRRYAKYLNEKALSYRTVAFDFCKVKRGKEDGTLRTMNAEKLLKTLPSLQGQLDALLEFDCAASDLTNGVINNAFMLLFRDLIRLFACYNDGIINLLEKYFDMNKKQCRDALDLYKRFLIRMDRVGEFLKVAENVGIDKGDIPDLTKAPSSLLDALEQHLATLEGRKGSAANTPTQSASTAFGTAASNSSLGNTGNGHIDDAVRQQALADEEAAMNQYKQAKVQSPTGGASTNPFLSSPPSAGQPIVDLFAAGAQPIDMKASDDLLQLQGNPFADMFGAPPPAAAQPAPVQNNMWMTNDNNFSSVFGTQDQPTGVGVDGQPIPGPGQDLFAQAPGAVPPIDFFAAPATDASFNQPGFNDATNNRSISPAKSAFDDLNDSIRAALGGSPSRPPPPVLQQPQQTQQQPQLTEAAQELPTMTAPVQGFAAFEAFDMGPQDSMTPQGGQIPGYGVAPSQAQVPMGFGSPAKQSMPGWGNILIPTSIVSPASQISAAGQPAAAAAAAATSGKVLTGDLDSSLASLAQNLNINKSAQPGMQWNSPKNTAKAGGPAGGWSPQPMAATTGAGYRPMGMQGMQGMPMGIQGVQGMQGVRPMMPGAPVGAPAPMPGAPIQQQPQPQQPIQTQANQVQLDPFGAL